MKNLQRWGGIAALYMAGAYIAGILFFIFMADYPSAVSPAENVPPARLLYDSPNLTPP